MIEKLRDFPQQFLYDPVIEDGPVPPASSYVIAGMGGSHLAGDILSMLRPERRVIIHPDYGLPRISKENLRESLIIASSYSGSTEEPIDAFGEARKTNLHLAALATGGKLWKLAEAAGVPRVRIPATGMQPRMALGFALRALLKLVGDETTLEESTLLASRLDVPAAEKEGKRVAGLARGKIPVIYASTQNLPIAYNWKIKFNETGKVPAFCNIFPELNHNEMNGFDCGPKAKELAERFIFFVIADERDDERVKKRMKITRKLLEERGITVAILALAGETLLEKIFQSLMTADWAAYYTAIAHGAEPVEVPMVEELKKRMAA